MALLRSTTSEITIGASQKRTCTRSKITCARFHTRKSAHRIDDTSTGTSATRSIRSDFPIARLLTMAIVISGCCKWRGIIRVSRREDPMAWVNTSPLVKTYTLEEFWALPDPPDRSKLELIAGVLYMSPPPEYTHDNVVARLNRLLIAELIRLGNKGTLYAPRAAIWTSERTYLEPDMFYLPRNTKANHDPERLAS